MKRHGFRALMAAVLFLFIATTSYAQSKPVLGTVKCGREPIAGVAVTNGYQTVRTDNKGRYRLPVDPRGRFIYMSTPSGYSAPVEDGIIKFYKPLDGTDGYDFSLDRKDRDDTVHGFIAIADPQVLKLSEIEKMAPAVEDIASTVDAHPYTIFHGMGCGDIVFDRQELYAPFNEALSAAGIPFYHSIGNHDMAYTNRTFESSLKGYEDVFGPSWYSYNVGKIHYVVLNDCFYLGRDYFYIGYLDEAQMAWLEDDLSHIAPGSTVVVTLHIPSTVSKQDRDGFRWNDVNDVLTNKKPLYDILGKYNSHIVSGHYHTTANSRISENIFEHNLAALSGAWWQGPLCTDGTPAGYGVFLCDGDDIKWYYKSVGHPFNYQMRLYTEFAAGTSRVVANVWNADPDWKVELYEDGEYSGEMERFETYDPDAKRLYSDKDRLEHKWISPTRADHFFQREIKPGTTRAEVVATDSFGQVYRTGTDIPGEQVYIPATSPEIRFTGRTITEDGSVFFDWSGTYFSFDYDGDLFELAVTDFGNNYFNLFIDGRFDRMISSKGVDGKLSVAVGDAGKKKNIRLQKRTEGEQGTVAIHGIYIQSRCNIYPSEPKTRHIEFIGNSLTCGFGTEGLSAQEPFKPETENCDLAFACITARYFDADYNLAAHSGQGAVRNWDDKARESAVAMQHRYLRTFDEKPDILWDFKASPHKPDVVVINLGSNDYSTGPAPSYAQFAGGYNSIIETVKNAYGYEIPVVCVTPRQDGPAFGNIRRIARESPYPNIYLAPMADEVCNATTDVGSVWHPNYSGHRKMAMALIPYISTATGWEMEEKPVK